MSATTRHLSEESVFDAADAGADAAERAHLEGCAECRALRDEVRAGLALAREAEVPEPSPLFWEAFRRQVGRRIVAEERPRWRSWLLPLAATAAVLSFAVLFLRGPVSGPSPGAAPVLPAWSVLPPADEDAGLAVLEGLGVAEADLAAVGEVKGLDEVLADLSDEEQDAVAKLLRAHVPEGAL